jgi:hypothetical protein
MFKLFPANHLALTDTLYTALNNVRAFRFQIVWSIKINLLFEINPYKKKNTLKIKLNFLNKNCHFLKKIVM